MILKKILVNILFLMHDEFFKYKLTQGISDLQVKNFFKLF